MTAGRLVITLEWSPHSRSYDCRIKGFGDIQFFGHDGNDLALNVGKEIKRWTKFLEEERAQHEEELRRLAGDDPKAPR
jgi:hypothetical protein